MAAWLVLFALLAPRPLLAQPLAGSPPDAGRPDGDGASATTPEAELEAFRRMVYDDGFVSGEDDPIGTGAQDEALQSIPLPAPEELIEDRIPAQEGAVLTAVAGVRETAHRLRIELRDGLTLGLDELEFSSRARLDAEVRYRLTVPEGAALVSLEVCDARGCRQGLPTPTSGNLSAYDDAARARSAGTSPLPIGHAVAIHDQGGAALLVRAAPVRPDAPPLVVRVGWAVRAEVRGGFMRTAFPARPADDRVARLALTVHAVDVVTPTLDGVPAEREETLPAAAAFVVRAATPLSAVRRASGVSFACGDTTCARFRAVTPRPLLRPGDVIVALDASPSTVASARGRIAPTALALRGMLPGGSRVRVVAFGARAEEVTAGWTAPTALPTDALALAPDRDLGPATRFEAVWRLVSGWTHRGAHLVVIGDGGWTEGASATAALAQARRAGVVVHVLDVADRGSTRSLKQAFESTPDALLEVGPQAESAAAGRGDEALVERLTSMLAPAAVLRVEMRMGRTHVALGPLPVGDDRVWEGPLSPTMRMSLDGTSARAEPAERLLGMALSALAVPHALAALAPEDLARTGAGVCGAHGPYPTGSAVAGAAHALALAHGRRCEAAESSPPAVAAEPAPSGVPAQVLLASLRRRVIPPARACFRADRRGRAAYQERAVLHLTLADREVVASSVEGELGGPLAACLLEAADRVEVPDFRGRIGIRWPLYTDPAASSPVLMLLPAVADEVDAVLHAE